MTCIVTNLYIYIYKASRINTLYTLETSMRQQHKNLCRRQNRSIQSNVYNGICSQKVYKSEFIVINIKNKF